MMNWEGRRSGHGLFYDNVQEFIWRDWKKKHKEPQSRQLVSRLRTKPKAS